MKRMNISMTTVVEKAKLLETLRTNREEHKKIVVEAKEGYLKKARAALTEKIDELLAGKVVAVYFSMNMPEDYTEVYDNSIAMLEWNLDDKIELHADEFRQLVRDEWDWSSSFYSNNSEYSVAAMSKVKK